MMRLKSVFLIFILTFFYTSCSNPTYLAPRTIKGYVIDVYTNMAPGEDKIYVGKTVRYFFYANGTYSSYFDQGIYQEGNYSYNRKGTNSARLICSYSENDILSDYVMLLKFSDNANGTWEGTYYQDQMGAENGTFTIVRKI